MEQSLDSKKKDARWLLEEKYNGVNTPEYEEELKRLASGDPLGYLIGWQPFLGLKIHLDSRPLIPRPETEWWTEQFISSLSSRKSEGRFSVVRLGLAARSATENRPADERSVRVLDLCAGSGAIGCAVLARLQNAHVSFGEIDPAHEATILKNIRENNLDESRASIRIGDLFEPFGDTRFDFIAANPPYIPENRTLDPSVALFEPSLALLSGEDGLDSIRRIAKEIPQRLAPGGVAWIECDSAHAVAACALFSDQGMKATLRTDQYAVPRLLVCRHTRARSAQ
ncbi:MAG TPA: HemK/PrmC family methyltransferase [Candidatus Paceibacterota bacterium]|nr:HemK/PrmC family methyltransferase [Candidatus Paceibacterota bacterium]